MRVFAVAKNANNAAANVSTGFDKFVFHAIAEDVRILLDPINNLFNIHL